MVQTGMVLFHGGLRYREEVVRIEARSGYTLWSPRGYREMMLTFWILGHKDLSVL